MITICTEYLRSPSNNAGETNRKSSNNMNGDAQNKPRYIDVVT